MLRTHRNPGHRPARRHHRQLRLHRHPLRHHRRIPHRPARLRRSKIQHEARRSLARRRRLKRIHRQPIHHIVVPNRHHKPMHRLDRHILPAIRIRIQPSRQSRRQNGHRNPRSHPAYIHIPELRPSRPLPQVHPARMRRIHLRILPQRVHSHRGNRHILNLRRLKPVPARPQRRRHRNRAVPNRPPRARPRRPRQTIPARRKYRTRRPISFDCPVHPAAPRSRPALRRRTRNIHALIHINRQVVQPRIAQQIRSIRTRIQHILPRKPHQTRNLLPLSPNRLQMPRQRVRLANPRRQSQRNPMPRQIGRLRILDRRLQSSRIVRHPIADRPKLLHAPLMLLSTRRAKILHANPLRVGKRIRPRIIRRHHHRPTRRSGSRRSLRLLQRALRRPCLRRIHPIQALRHHRPGYSPTPGRKPLRRNLIHIVLIRSHQRRRRIAAQNQRTRQRSAARRQHARLRLRNRLVHIRLAHRLNRLSRRHQLRLHRRQRRRSRRRNHPVLRAHRPIRQMKHRRVIQTRRIRPRIRSQVHAQEPIRPHRHHRLPGRHLQSRRSRESRPTHQHRPRSRLPIRQVHGPLHRSHRLRQSNAARHHQTRNPNHSAQPCPHRKHPFPNRVQTQKGAPSQSPERPT